MGHAATGDESKGNSVQKLGSIYKVVSVHRQTASSNYGFQVDERKTP